MSIVSDKKERVHFIGIGGTGMSPLAEIALARGFAVQGSDTAITPNTKRLEALGATIFPGQRAGQLTGVDVVVYSSAISADNLELADARQLGTTAVHRSDFLLRLMQNQKVISVAGTHGKTTTSAMIAHMLKVIGLDPTAAIGGRMLEYNSYALLGDGAYFVAEADESDGSFLKYSPFISIITNVDNDHLDYFTTFENIQSAFTNYLSNTDPEGYAIIGWDNATSQAIGREFRGNRLAYGIRIGSEVRAIDYKSEGPKISFNAIVERQMHPCEIPVIGKHNVLNALCALSVARVLGLDIAAAIKALASFRGVSRRLSLVYKNHTTYIYDDYAHNPGKIRASIHGLRESWPDYKIHVIYQPHRYSRLDTMYNETMGAFKEADFTTVLPVYAAGESTDKDYSSATLSKDICTYSGIKASSAESFDHCLSLLAPEDPSNTIFLTVGAGDIWKVAHLIKNLLNGDVKDLEKNEKHFRKTET